MASADVDGKKEKLDAVLDVDIDDSGIFKYILIKLYIGEKTKCVVRGFGWAEYHGRVACTSLLFYIRTFYRDHDGARFNKKLGFKC